jgi:hypothetical protein
LTTEAVNILLSGKIIKEMPGFGSEWDNRYILQGSLQHFHIRHSTHSTEHMTQGASSLNVNMEKEETLDLDTTQNNHDAESRDRKGENIQWVERGSREVHSIFM